MSEEAEVRRKIKRACQLLLQPRYRIPGAKGWELRRSLGKGYAKILEALDNDLGMLDLRVVRVLEDGEEPAEPTQEQMDRARYMVRLRGRSSLTDAEAAGWRIDDLAALAASLAFLVSKNGKASRKDIQEVLREKFPKWKVESVLERFSRKGYLSIEKEDLLSIGWRSRAEVDLRVLMNLILTASIMKVGLGRLDSQADGKHTLGA